ncbi:hypothetical protein PG993_002392 [Apiospora rasikravindrae]|uniref:Uncharacterized protein n=1 Tax=Apiospora rasikravindrae TaxID=990691 RepID=A0ABR1TWY3_9PEZI
MALPATSTVPDPSVEVDHQQVLLVPAPIVQPEAPDDAASDTYNAECIQNTECRHKAQELIPSSRFINGLLIDLFYWLPLLLRPGIWQNTANRSLFAHGERGRLPQPCLSQSKFESRWNTHCSIAYQDWALATVSSHRTMGILPLGSQASLRFISIQSSPVRKQLDIAAQYSYPQVTWESACVACKLDARNSMFQAAFLPFPNTWKAPQDSWGNLKIPLIEDINSGDAIEGWRDVSMQPEVLYTSVVGIPLLLPSGNGNMTFTMESWYWNLENATLWAANSTGPLLQSTREFNHSNRLTNFTGINGIWQFAVPDSMRELRISTNEKDALSNSSSVTGIPITFEAAVSGRPLNNAFNVSYTYGIPSKDEPQRSTRLDAVLVQRPVELNVTCTISSCSVTHLRARRLAAKYISMDDSYYLIKYFFPHITQAFINEHHGTPQIGVLEAYLYDPSRNPYVVLRESLDLDLTGISAKTLGNRLSQVINAYWMVENQFLNAAGGLNTPFDAMDSARNATRNSTITAVNDQEYLHCDNRWAVALCMPSIMLLLAALASTVLSFFRLAPDCTDFLSALTLNDGRLLLEGGSSLDEYERVRLLKDVRLKVGDVRSWEQVGQTIIAQDGHVGPLKKKRMYW